MLEAAYDPAKAGAHFCDFCGKELLGGEHYAYRDGRESCVQCAVFALTSEDEFKAVFQSVQRNMEAFFGIKIASGIKARITNAKKIARHVNKRFVPTSAADNRTVGFAKRDRNGFSFYIENGAPRLSAVATIVHELTHIWQYQNWKKSDLCRYYGEDVLEIYEGMAKWVEIQYLYRINETWYAGRQEVTTHVRGDVYGTGFNKYCRKYPLTRQAQIGGVTPFDVFPPI